MTQYAICYGWTERHPLYIESVRDGTLAEVARWERKRLTPEAWCIATVSGMCELPAGASVGSLLRYSGISWQSAGEHYSYQRIDDPQVLDPLAHLLRAVEALQLPAHYDEVAAALMVVSAARRGCPAEHVGALREAWFVMAGAERRVGRATASANEIMREQTQPQLEIASASASLDRLRPIGYTLETARTCCTAALRVALGRDDAAALIARLL
ncbi:MAG: hypothetical protein ACYTFG_18165 [Planctomycetota bacterium]|jgi:hypothetical protein